jgi:hypothetical protein
MAAEESSQPAGEESEQPTGEVTEGKEEDPEHMAEEMDRLDAIAETLAQIVAMLQDSGKRKADHDMSETSKSIKSIDERLSKVEKSASRGPVRTVVKAAPVATVDKAAKAAEYRAKAAATSDPALASGYLLLASEADNAKD